MGSCLHNSNEASSSMICVEFPHRSGDKVTWSQHITWWILEYTAKTQDPPATHTSQPCSCFSVRLHQELHHAATKGCEELVKALLSAYAFVEWKDEVRNSEYVWNCCGKQCNLWYFHTVYTSVKLSCMGELYMMNLQNTARLWGQVITTQIHIHANFLFWKALWYLLQPCFNKANLVSWTVYRLLACLHHDDGKWLVPVVACNCANVDYFVERSISLLLHTRVLWCSKPSDAWAPMSIGVGIIILQYNNVRAPKEMETLKKSSTTISRWKTAKLM